MPTTSAASAAAAALQTVSVTWALVKSIQTSAAPLDGSAPVTETPSASPPASTPASLPMAGCPARSQAAVSFASGAGRGHGARERPSHAPVGAQHGDADRRGSQQAGVAQLRSQLFLVLRRQRIKRRADLVARSAPSWPGPP